MKRKVYKAVNDSGLLDQISFIIFVAGFRFSVVDKKWPNIKKAFNNFSVDKVSKYTKKDVDRVLKSKDMIKNRGKIEAIVENAKYMVELRKKHGTVLKHLDNVKKAHKKDPMFNSSLKEEFKNFHRIGDMTSGWLENLYSARGKFVEYEVPGK